MTDRTLVSGLPRNQHELKITNALLKESQPRSNLPFNVASVSCRVTFECGCSYERCLVGNFAPGLHIIPCYKHRNDDDVADLALNAYGVAIDDTISISGVSIRP